MISPRRFVLLAGFFVAGVAVAQSPPPGPPASRTPMAAASPASAFADDERTARLAERYEGMLAANPVEGIALDRLWKIYEDHGATAILIEKYRRMTAESTPTAALIYGHLLKRAGRLDEAAAAYERAAKLDPNGSLPLLAQAEMAAVRSKPADAAVLLEKALAKLPSEDRRRNDLLLKLGDSWAAAGQPLKAGQAWEEIVASDPANFALRKQLAANYEKNGLPERAIGHDEYIDAHAPPAERTAALRELGRLHEVRGEFDDARDALERGLALTSKDNWIYGDLQTRLIRLYQRAGKGSELEARWRAAVEQAPRDLGGYLRLIALAEAQGNTADERGWLEKLVALTPRDRENTLKLARLCADAGDRERAVALYDQLLRLQPGNIDLVLARAELDLQAGRAADAVTRVEARLAQNSSDETIATPALRFFLSHRLDEAAERILKATVTRQPAALDPSLALARFYFAQRRPDEGRAILESLVNQPGDSTTRAGRLTAVADAYKDGNQPEDALRSWQQAAALQPASAAPMVAAAELMLARGDTREAGEQLERAAAVAPDGPERVEIEHKLFQVLSDASAPANRGVSASPVFTPRRHPPLSAGISARHPFTLAPEVKISPEIARGGKGQEEDLSSRPLARYTDGLEKTASDRPTMANYLRLARWQQWCRLPGDAAISAQKALEIDPGNVPARELQVESAIAQHRNHAAEGLLREIIVLDPTRKNACSKQIADLLLGDGEFDAALVILDGLQREAPGSVTALTDLALGQQRADRWYDALATWERAYALPRLTPAQRADLRQPMLSVYERLGQFQQAAEVLRGAVDAQDDLEVRQELFHQLVVFCQNHSLGDWLRAQYEARQTAQPQDYFTLIALAELRKAGGKEREAYRLLAQAYYSSPDPAGALRALVAEAESLGESDEAIVHQKRLVALPGQASAENLQKLAELQETSLDDTTAIGTWEQIVATFPRDTAALGAAADFFEKIGRIGRVRDLLTQVVALDATDFRRMYHLGQLDAEAGDIAGARACLELILARTEAEKPGDPLLVPTELDLAADPVAFAMTAGRGARVPIGPAPAAASASLGDNDDRHLRLKVIRQMTRLLFPGEPGDGVPAAPGLAEDRRRWLERWRGASAAGARSEPLAAFFFAGQKEPVMELTESWLQPDGKEPDERAQNAYLLAGLRLGEYARLARWTWSEPDNPENAPKLLDSLQHFLATGGRPGPTLAAELFPATIKSRTILWQAASAVFAEKRWYPEAIELGERALTLPGGSTAANSLELAQWEINAGRLDAARDVLRRAVEEGGGTSFDASAGNAVFADLRAYYLLLPPEQRATFVGGYLTRMQTRGGNPVHAVLAAALLHGLAGEKEAAVKDLERLVALRLLDSRSGEVSPSVRRWTFLSVNGVQLQAWNLDAMAAHLWRRALQEATTFDKNDSEIHGILADIRTHLLASEVVTAADPQQARERIEEYLHEQPPIGSMAMAAAALLNISQFPAAMQLYERLCRLAPNEAEYLRNLLAAYDASGNRVASERLLTTLLDGKTTLPTGMNRLELIVRLANLRENAGDAAGAQRLLDQSRRAFPHTLALLTPLAQSLEKAKQLDAAAAVWREATKLDAGLSCRLSLAAVEERRGQAEQAAQVLKEGLGASPDAGRGPLFVRLVGLYLTTGRTAEAADLAREWIRDGRLDNIPDVAAAFAQHGQRPTALELLAAAGRRTRDPAARFRLQLAAVTQLADPGEPLPIFIRELRRLEGLASSSDGLRYQFASIQFELATKRGATDWLEGELKKQWRGEQGDIVAGDQLALLYQKNKQEGPLGEIVSTIDHRPNLPQEILFALESRLVEGDYAALALPLSERLYRRFPQNEAFVLMRVRALWKSDHRDEARRLLDVADAASTLRDDFTGQVGRLCLELGDRAGAGVSFERMVARDPLAVRSPDVHARLAMLYLEDNRLAEAYGLLRAAYRNPTMTDMEPLLNFLAAAKRLKVDDAGHLPGGEFPLTFSRRAQLLASVYDRLAQSGRAGDGRRLAAAHPELLAVAPGLAARLGHDATPDELSGLTTLLENALSQADPPAPRLQNELAKLYVRRAELALSDQPPRPAEAINHLTRATQLQPDNFLQARQLALLYREQKQDARAAEVLRAFLAPDALPAEREQARQILDRK